MKMPLLWLLNMMKSVVIYNNGGKQVIVPDRVEKAFNLHSQVDVESYFTSHHIKGVCSILEVFY